MAVLVKDLTVHSGVDTIGHARVVSVEDSTLVYSTDAKPASRAVSAPSAGAFSLARLEHSVWTPARLRSVCRTRFRDDRPEFSLKRRVRGALLVRWVRGISEHEPHAVDAWYSIVSAWLRGADHEEVAERFFLGRRWAYQLVSRYLGAASFYLFADDLRAGVCRQTHGSAGGRGGSFFRDGAGMFAETCSACVLLRGADWEGWVAVEEK